MESFEKSTVEYIPKLHSEILRIMDVIDELCEKNNIKYYMIGGTLLGAVRHGGFIPWDDDFDIIMPRRDFDKFIQCCKNDLPNGYSLRWISTDKRYWRIFAKISNDNTRFVERIGHSGLTDCGIFVDVFPVDDSNGYNKTVQTRKNIIEKVKVIISSKKDHSTLRGWKRAVSYVVPNRMLFTFAHYLMTKDNNKGATYYSNYGSQYPIKRRTIGKIKVDNGVRIPFEDRFYYAPKDYAAVLTNIFGQNYMQLPPEEKRKTHYPLYVKFSDGSTIDFDKQTKRLTINDTL